MNGDPAAAAGAPKIARNYKLLSDPFLTKGVQKIYRYDGVVPGDSAFPQVIPRDPRNPLHSRMRSRLDLNDLPLPRFELHLKRV